MRRWLNQLSPDINRAPFTLEEDAVVVWGHLRMGSKWAAIAKLLSGRPDYTVKNRWNCTLRHCEADLVAAKGGTTPDLSLDDVRQFLTKHRGKLAPRRRTFPPPTCVAGRMSSGDADTWPAREDRSWDMPRATGAGA